MLCDSQAANFTERIQILGAETLLIANAQGVSIIVREGDFCPARDRAFVERPPVSGAFRCEWLAMIHREAVAIEDIYRDVRVPHDAYRLTFVKSLLIVPIRREDPSEALGIYWSQLRQPSPGEIANLQAVADSAAGTVQRLGFALAAFG